MITYLYICIYGKIVDFGESDKMTKKCGKVDKSNIYKFIVIFHSLLTKELHQTKHILSFSKF